MEFEDKLNQESQEQITNAANNTMPDESMSASDKLERELDDLLAEVFQSQNDDFPSDESYPGDAKDIPPVTIELTEPRTSTSSITVAPVVPLEDEVVGLYAEGYCFPEDVSGGWPTLKAMSVTELADALGDLSFKMNGAKLVPYEEIRSHVCAISVELNLRGKLAPRFRQFRRPSRKPTTADEVALSRDRQFIDLHWLHSTGWNRLIHGDRWQFHNVLKVKTFQAVKAEMFAAVPAPMDEKAGWLALPDNIAFQLAAIQTDSIRVRYRVASQGDIVKGKERQIGHLQVTQLLETSTMNQPHLQAQIPRWANIWMCARLVGDDPEVLRKFHAFCEGLDKPIDSRDMARRLNSIKDRVNKTRPDDLLAA